MTLRQFIEAAPARAVLLALGACFAVSCITLLGDGLDHLPFFLPLAVINAAVGAFTSERVARATLLIETLLILGGLAYQFVHLHERTST